MGLKKAIKRLIRKFTTGSADDFKSMQYWESRYMSGNNSGAGSYGRLAQFKADVINRFVADQKIQTIIEFGSGDGNQLTLAQYPQYTGFDVSAKAIEISEKLFENDDTKRFYLYQASTFDIQYKNLTADATLSLDVIYHLIEDIVFEDYMTKLFATSNKWVIIYASNYEKRGAKHVKSRMFSQWITDNLGGTWTLFEKIDNIYPFDERNPDHTSMSDFYIYKKN